MSEAPPPVCMGCGRSHQRGSPDDCGYDRAVRWTPYTRAEQVQHMRFFPVVAGVAAAGLAVYLLLYPPGAPLLFYAGVLISIAIALVVGGMGTRALVAELRKTRWRGVSEDGRDRALVATVGGRVRYGFGESLRYAKVREIGEAAALRSPAALAAVSELRTAISDAWLEELRADAKDDAVFEADADPDETLALVAAAAIWGLAARGEVELFNGRYRGWGRGGSKMKNVTRGDELAVTAVASADDAEHLEREILERCGPSERSPTHVGTLVQQLVDEDRGFQWLASLPEPATGERESALDAWRWLLEDDAELVIRMIEHTLLVEARD